MRFHAFLTAAITATALFIGTQGCSSEPAASGPVKCTPGNYVFCRCADRTEGTKLCNADSVSFQACSTGGAGECAGGEDLTDPGEGEPVPPPPPAKPPEEAGPPGSPVDTCPGKPTAVIPGPETVINGDTTGATSDLKGRTGACAAGDGGPDHVYHLQPSGGSGSLSIKVQGEGAFNPVVYLRSGACTDAESQSACAPPLGAGKLVQFSTNVVNGRDYYLVVDGASGSVGKYTLTMKLTPGPFCGDGKVDANEACDDGANKDGDGCSAGCNGISGDPTSGDGCTTGHPVDMWKGKVVSGTGSTLTYGNTFTKTGTSCTVSANDLNAAQDHIYAVTAHSAGNLKVTLTPTEATYNVMLVARKTCTDPNSQGAGMCANLSSAGVAEVMTFPVANGEKVYVAAEGALNAKGSYTIKFELP